MRTCFAAGKYTLGFRYAAEKTWADAFRKAEPGVAIWEGEVTTKPAAVEVVVTP